jgi:VWFA-related protein
MKSFPTASLAVIVLLGVVSAQTPIKNQKIKEDVPEDVVRITTSLVQTDVVVTDKNDQIIPDLKLEDFELYDNGRKQQLKFMEFVGIESGRRTEGKRPGNVAIASEAEADVSAGITARNVKRIVAFVIDDLTIPFEDLPSVRKMLLDYVDNKMAEGDLVAIVRVLGGKGLLQQFTSDRRLLRRAIAQIKITINPYMASTEPDPVKTVNPIGTAATDSPTAFEAADAPPEIYSSNDDQVRLVRGLSALTTAGFVLDSLREVPGRKSLVIISGGVPIFEIGSSGSAYSNITYLLNVLSDKAVRSGVVINTLDPRGLKATPGVVSFRATPARSALGGSDPNDFTFGRGGALDQAAFGPLLAGASEHLGLNTVAAVTGGVSVINTNNFEGGLDKILARSRGYYELAYSTGDKFDSKFHKLEIKVKRSGARVFHHSGYLAREEKAKRERTYQEQIAAAALSPLASRDIDVSPNVTVKLATTSPALVDIHMLIEGKSLQFENASDGKHQTTLDVVGFVFDELGRQRGGFSETINLNLTEQNYNRALKEGLTYSASTQLPPGYYQIRSVVREGKSGLMGTFSKYIEIPDLSKGRLAASSLFLFGIDPAQPNAPTPLLALRQLTRKQDLRYALTVYNANVKDSRPQVKSQVIISQGGKVLFTEPEQLLEPGKQSPLTKMGQLGLAKVPTGRYVVTVVISDANDSNVKIARSIDFTLVD